MNPHDPRFHDLVDLTRVAERLSSDRADPEFQRLEKALKALLEEPPTSSRPEVRAAAARAESRQGEPWFERDVERFSAERRAISQWLEPVDGSALFGIDGRGQLHADGRVRFGARLGPRLAIRFPTGYPSATPEFFVFGDAGSTPVRAEASVTWHEERDCGGLLANVVATLKGWLGGRSGRTS